MRRPPLPALALALALGLSAGAHATGRLAEVTLIDRDSGSALPTYYHRGEYWVAGRPGAHYTIQVHNSQDRRILAVTSVDGVNVVTGQSAGFAQSGYVFDAFAGYQIDGWRKSDSEVAAFVFTALPDSYAARTGRPENVGVIGVALFPERRQPQPVADLGGAPEASRDAGSVAKSSVTRERNAQFAASAPTSPRLGTGHGEREQSWATRVAFERESPRPAEVVRIRYNSYANLVAMGIIRVPRRHPPVPQPFPGQDLTGFVPDP